MAIVSFLGPFDPSPPPLEASAAKEAFATGTHERRLVFRTVAAGLGTIGDTASRGVAAVHGWLANRRIGEGKRAN